MASYSVTTTYSNPFTNNFNQQAPKIVSSANKDVLMIIIAVTVAVIITYLLTSIIAGKIFQKAGKKFNRGFIPIYNEWLMFEIAGLPGALVLVYLLGFIPILGTIVVLVVSLILAINLAKKFNKSTLFAVFGLFIFSLIGYLILAFDKSTYNFNNSVDNNQYGTPPDSNAGLPPIPPINPSSNPTSPTPQASPTPQNPDQEPGNSNGLPPTNISPSSPIPPVV